ncbi:MAG: type I-C CRISPR-associated protein Cas8c/Csd1 [Nitrospira sp.]|nr:type I-C CRISPR-associated protein Cas8c/Csd1 [bacterium]MBL7049411.1 type I-C CRISPR-associated protein Cas8c/Csd1 [Nitrospira sp.]
MIKELSEFGKTIRGQNPQQEWMHNALKEEPISMELVIREDGSFYKFELFEKKMTIAEAINAKKGKARLLLDKAEEILCYGDNKSKKKHELFLSKLEPYKALVDMAPVLAFYGQNKSDGVEKALEEFEIAIPDEKNRTGNIGFRIQGCSERIHEKTAIRQAIIDIYETAQKKLLLKNQKQCSLCGKSDYPVEDIPHGMVKKVPEGQSSGCALVSYNENAFESYELKGNNNSSICTNCAKAYVEGLNTLLSSGNEIVVKSTTGKEKKVFRYSNRKNFGKDTAMVFWTRKNSKLPEIDQLEAPDPDDVARLIESVTSGTERDSRYHEPDQFYSCTLSGSAARIAVRDWIETSLLDFRKAIAKWFQDIAIDEYNGDLKKTKIHYARLYDLARSCQRTNEDGKTDKQDASLARVAMFLWNGALNNTTPPLWILTKVLQRARLDKYGVTADRAALIKLILNRHNKGGEFMISEKIEEGSRPTAYICGQIFAKVESIQYAALKDLNAGIRERYFTYAMTLPASAFGRIFDLNSKHFTKLKSEKPGLAITLDKELQELCKDVDINSFPATFSLEQKGQFAIGYYQQKQKQFKSSKNKTEEE